MSSPIRASRHLPHFVAAPTFLLPVLMFWALVGAVPTASAEPSVDDSSPACKVEPIVGGVECIAPDGETQWETHHPSLWPDEDAYLDARGGQEPTGPVVIDDIAVYAVERDLLEIDPQDGVVENRFRLPASIADLARADDLLQIVLDVDESQPHHLEVPSRTVTHRPGSDTAPTASLSIEDIVGQVATAVDAEWLAGSATTEDQAIALLEQASRVDPTNPFFSHLLGAVLAEAGDETAARQAFSKAADSPDAVWQDLMRISALLEDTIAPAHAEQALSLGFEQMNAMDIDAEQLAGLLPVITTMLGNTEEVAAVVHAIETGDIERALVLGMELAGNLPDLASLGEEWERIADENQHAGYDLIREALVELDRATLAAASLLITLVLLVFLVGLRSGLRRRLRIVDLLAPLVMVVGLVALTYVYNTHLTVAEEIAAIPLEDLQSGLNTPQGQQWLMDVAHNPDVHELISSVLTSNTDLDDDAEPVERIPLIRLLVEAAYHDAEQAQWELFKQGRMPDLVAVIEQFDNGDSDVEAPGSTSLFVVLIPLFGLALLGTLGFAVSRFAPFVARPVTSFVPGGPDRLAPLGALLLLAFVAAVLAVLGFDSAVQQLAIPHLEHHLGIDEAAKLSTTHPRTWAWITLATVALVHGAIVAWDHSRKASEDPETPGR